MLSLLPTAQHYDALISLTHRFTQTGISKIAPGTITPASKIWLDFSYQPILFVLMTIERLESEASSDNPNPTDNPNPSDHPNPTDRISPTAPVAGGATDDKPQHKNIEQFEIDIDGTPVAVSYNPTWSRRSKTAHFEFRSTFTPPQPIPSSESGYHSHFTTTPAVLEYSTPQAYAKAYIESHRIKAFKVGNPKSLEESPKEQITLTLDFHPTASDEPDPELPATLPAPLRTLCPLTVGEVVEISDSLHPKHAARQSIGKRGKIAKLNRDFDTATIELIENGERYTLPILNLERVKLPEVTYLGQSQTVGYAIIDSELRGWLGFKNKTLYKEWCCRTRSHNARLKGIGDPKRTSHLLKHKWECQVQKPTMKKLKALAEHDLNHNPPAIYTKRQLPEAPPNIRPILKPGTAIEITSDGNGLANRKGRVGTVIIDYLKNGIADGIVLRLDKNTKEYVIGGEFRVVDTEPQPKNAPLVDHSPPPLAA